MVVILLIVVAAAMFYVFTRDNSGNVQSREIETSQCERKTQEISTQPVIDTMLVNLVDITINKIGKVHSDGILVHIKDGYQRIVFEDVKYDEFFQSLLGEKDLGGLSYDYILTNHYSMTDNEAWLLRHQNGSLEIADWVIMGNKLVNQDTMKRIVNVVETHNEKVAISKYACSPWEVYVRCDILK